MITKANSLSEWAAKNGISAEKANGIAISVNEKVVPRSKWSTFILNENDKILAVQATQGG